MRIRRRLSPSWGSSLLIRKTLIYSSFRGFLMDNEIPSQTEGESPELPKKLVQEPRRISQEIKKPSRIKRFWTECARVLRVTKKPDKVEFLTIVKVSALGMAVVGFIGFALHFLREILFK